MMEILPRFVSSLDKTNLSDIILMGFTGAFLPSAIVAYKYRSG